MYKKYFGLRETPFSIAPDPRYLYLSELHREALAHLMYGMDSDGGFILLTGEVGTGKTTICRSMLEQVPGNINIAFILNPKMTVEELLASICDELGVIVPEKNTSVKVFVDYINKYLLEEHARGRKTVLIIEEAQNLSTEVLEQLRLLTNLETNERKLLQIIMLGQPELQEKLARPELRQLAQRITARFHLEPLSAKDISAYVKYRLAIAGVYTELFPAETISKLYRLSGGIPRLINLLCDRALLGAYVQEHRLVNRHTLAKAAREVFGSVDPRKRWRERLLTSKMALIAVIAVVVCFLLSAGYYYRDRLSSLADISMGSITWEGIVNNVFAGPGLTVLKWAPGFPQDSRTRDAAFQALFRQWDMDYEPRVNGPACHYAREQGLRCLESSGDLSTILTLNRPVMLKVFDSEGRPFFVTVTSLKGQTATLVAGKKTFSNSVKVIESYWSGEYMLFWRPPPDYNGNIRPGDKGKMVAWLDNQIAIIQGRKARPGGGQVLKGELLKQLRSFQLLMGLTPDGIIGAQTIIQFNNLTNGEVPKLTVN
ncbi:MAG: AAA family ATPase [Nitrospirota bacterium]|nr:AAA family ATPase [Nitrospirota bacterium]